MTQSELNFIKYAFSQIIDDIAGNLDWGDAARAVASDLGTLERKLEKRVTELPSNIDEAAEEWVEDDDNIRGGDYIACAIAEKAFKAGAEWMAGQGGKIKGWLARHRNGELCFFFNQPEYKLYLGWVDEHQHWRVIDANLFPEIKFKNSPVEVIVQLYKK